MEDDENIMDMMELVEAIESAPKSKSKPVLVYYSDGTFYRRFSSLEMVEKWMGRNPVQFGDFRLVRRMILIEEKKVSKEIIQTAVRLIQKRRWHSQSQPMAKFDVNDYSLADVYQNKEELFAANRQVKRKNLHYYLYDCDVGLARYWETGYVFQPITREQYYMFKEELRREELKKKNEKKH